MPKFKLLNLIATKFSGYLIAVVDAKTLYVDNAYHDNTSVASFFLDSWICTTFSSAVLSHKNL